jgi:hypothetical protein
MKTLALRTNIYEDWNHNHKIRNICLHLLEYSKKLPPEGFSKSWSLSEIEKITGTSDRRIIMQGVHYLSGDRTSVLKPQFEFLDGSIASVDVVKSALDKSEDAELEEIICKWIFLQKNLIA